MSLPDDAQTLMGVPLEGLSKRLSAVLRSLLDDGAHYLVVETDPETHSYVQFMPVDGGGLYCEAVSNEFLSGSHRLTPDDEEVMIGLGWASPDPNFKQLWDYPVPVHIVAERTVKTLTTVYGFADTGRLRVKVGLRTRGPVTPPTKETSDPLP